MAPLEFAPIKLETVAVLRDGKPVGTIKRFRAHKQCIVNVPGLMSAATHRPTKVGEGRRSFRTIDEAKAALIELEAAIAKAEGRS